MKRKIISLNPDDWAIITRSLTCDNMDGKKVRLPLGDDTPLELTTSKKTIGPGLEITVEGNEVKIQYPGPLAKRPLIVRDSADLDLEKMSGGMGIKFADLGEQTTNKPVILGLVGAGTDGSILVKVNGKVLPLPVKLIDDPKSDYFTVATSGDSKDIGQLRALYPYFGIGNPRAQPNGGTTILRIPRTVSANQNRGRIEAELRRRTNDE